MDLLKYHLNYKAYSKSNSELIDELELDDTEQKYLDQAIALLKRSVKHDSYSAWDLFNALDNVYPSDLELMGISSEDLIPLDRNK